MIDCHRLSIDRNDPGDFDLLDERERRHAEGLRFERDRWRYIAAHAQVRRILGTRCGLPPDALPLRRSRHGKPLLALAGTTCHFSLSHSGEIGWLAVAPYPVGLDVERLARWREAERTGRAARPAVPAEGLGALITSTCTPAEADDLLALDEADRVSAFLALWTRKEAVLKAWGLGLGIIEPSRLPLGLHGAGPVRVPDEAAHLGCRSLFVTTLANEASVLSVAAAAARQPELRLHSAADLTPLLRQS